MRRYINIFRWKEALFFCWFSIMGLFFVKDIAIEHPIRSLVMILSVYLINLWGLLTNDYFEKNIDMEFKKYLSISFIIIFLSTFLMYNLGYIPLLLMFLVGILFLIYSMPLLYFKSNLIISQLIHILSGVFYFFIPIYVFNAYSLWLIKIGIVLSLAFVGGHINHEIRDYEEDLLLGYRTLPVVIGKKKSFLIAGIIFSVSFILLGILCRTIWTKMLTCLFFIFHILIFLYVYYQDISRKKILLYQFFYRLIFTLEVIIISLFS